MSTPPLLPNDPTAPIPPARFAAALRELSLPSLHLKVLELRNSLLHLAFSNAQLRPFADGTATAPVHLAPGQPDPDCADAIAENDAVMARMRHRIALVRAEVVRRGASWRAFEARDVEEAGVLPAHEPGVVVAAPQDRASPPRTNGVNAGGADATDATPSAHHASPARNPWTDGTFQMGTIRNGELHMDAEPPRRPNGAGVASGMTTNPTTTTTTAAAAAAASSSSAVGSPQAIRGGRLADEELRRLLEIRLAEEAGADEQDGGLHL